MNLNERMKFNSKMAYEIGVLHNAADEELKSIGEEGYETYHMREYDNISFIKSKYQEILNLPEPKMGNETIYSYLSRVRSAPTLNSEQKKQLNELRNQPDVIRVFGLTALQQQSNLEDILGTKINNSSEIATVGEEGSVPMKTFKSEQTLDREFDGYQTTLSQALDDGKISEEIYESYSRDLGYIQDYFASQSRGEQVGFEKISNSDFEKLEEESDRMGMSINELIILKNEDKRESFIEHQQVSSEMQDGPTQ